MSLIPGPWCCRPGLRTGRVRFAVDQFSRSPLGTVFVKLSARETLAYFSSPVFAPVEHHRAFRQACQGLLT